MTFADLPFAEIFLLAGLLGLGSVLAWVAFKVRRHRRLLDRRIDVLAEESRERARSLGRRVHELADRLETLERRERVDHLGQMLAMAERGGRVSGPAARDLDRAILELRADVRAREE